MTKAIIEMENGGVMTLELYPETAPITVENFVKLAKEGFYNGLIFHRVIAGFMIQGEFAANGVNNPLKHTRGVISMARSARPDSAGSQFFIMHQNAPHLDGSYAAFGKMTDGFDVLDRIANVPTDWSDKPVKPQKMKSVTIVEE